MPGVWAPDPILREALDVDVAWYASMRTSLDTITSTPTKQVAVLGFPAFGRTHRAARTSVRCTSLREAEHRS
ncbi:hypothetical protein ACYBSK_19220 [Streptomyces sp. BYX5S]